MFIIESEMDGTLYKGFTSDYMRRLEEHNQGKSCYTSRKAPWKLLYVEQFESKTAALIKEKQLKRCNRKYIEWLCKQPFNLIRNNIAG